MIFFEADINLEDKVTVLTLLVSQTQVKSNHLPFNTSMFSGNRFPWSRFFYNQVKLVPYKS